MAPNGDDPARLGRRALLQCLAASAFACAHRRPEVTTLCGFYSERRLLTSFDNVHQSLSHVVWPQSVDALATFLRRLEPGRRLSFRSGANSIDEQALNDDIVVMLTADAFKHVGAVTVEDDVAVITVGASASWRRVLAATTREGFVPMAVPSAAEITAGGGLASHSISRFSPVWQKEGNHVRRLTVMLLDGAVRVLRRDSAAVDPDEYALFLGVVAGLGFLGAILDVTYELLRVAPPGAQVQVATRSTIVDPRTSSTALFLQVKERAEALLRAYPPVLDLRAYAPGGARAGQPFAEPTPTLYATIWWSACGMDRRTMIGESRYVYDRHLTPMIVYEPDNELMGVMEGLMMSSPWIDRAVQDVAIDLFASGAVAVNTAEGFSFFQDANVLLREREHGEPRIIVMQQTFLLRDAASGSRFLEELDEFVRTHHELPTLCDLLWIPKDSHPFRLSATALRGAFALTLTYLRRDGSYTDRLRADLRGLARSCRARGGVVHLVKSVEVNGQNELEEAYGAQFTTFRDLKRRYDPQGRLVNNFYRRVLGPWTPPGA